MSKSTFARRAVRAASAVLAACAAFSPAAKGVFRSAPVQVWMQSGAEPLGNPTAVAAFLPIGPHTAGAGRLTLEKLREVSFPDLPENAADADAVRFAACQGLIQGYGNGTFRPDGLLTRGQAVTILRRTARLLGLEQAYDAALGRTPEAETYNRLELHSVSVNGVGLLLDEAAEARFLSGGDETAALHPGGGASLSQEAPASPPEKTDAQWAVEAGILPSADGLNRRADRAQTAEYLYRFAKWAGADVSCTGNLDPWPDGGNIPEGAKTALSWGMESGVFRTIVEDALAPSLPVSRGQAARLVTALIARVPPKTFANGGSGTDPDPFSDAWMYDSTYNGGTYSGGTYSGAGVENDPFSDAWMYGGAYDGSEGTGTGGGADSESGGMSDRPLADDAAAEQSFYEDGTPPASDDSSWYDPNHTPEAALAAEISSRTDRGTPSSRSRDRHDELQETIDAIARKYHATGLQVAVIEDGKLTDTYTYGWARKNSVPMTEDHKLRTASISKVLVGLSAMWLREQGTVDLDASIGTYWNASIRNPRYPNTPVNIRSLLTHTSSIYTTEVSLASDAVRSRLTSGNGFGRGKPGSLSCWNYNNYAFGVLGMTLEKAAGRTLDDILDQAVFKTLDIDASFYGGDLDRTDLVATMYTGSGVGRSAEKQTSAHAGAPGGNGSYFAGGFTSSARDLGKIAALLANDGVYEGVRLLSAESVDLMEYREKVWLEGGFCQAMPLRYRMDAYGRERLYYHTGSAYGAYNGFSYDPDARDGVVVLTSGASGAKDKNGNYAVCGAIYDALYKAIAR